MIRYSTCVTVLSLFVAACLAQPSHAADDPKKDPSKADDSAFIAAMKAELKTLETNLSNDIGGKIDGLKKNVRSLETDIARLKVQQFDLKTQLDSQKIVIDQLLEERKKVIANSSPTEKRISNYGASAAAGRMMLVNLYSESVLFTVNGDIHVVPPGRSKSLEGVAAGVVRYEVFSGRHGYLDQQAINLLTGETFTLTVYPQR